MNWYKPYVKTAFLEAPVPIGSDPDPHQEGPGPNDPLNPIPVGLKVSPNRIKPGRGRGKGNNLWRKKPE